jgi:ATP adenylyltransferase
MDRLWSPWRYQYVTSASTRNNCIFCDKGAAHRDDEDYIVARGEHNYVLLNLYPYTSGHLMIAPYAHVAALRETTDQILLEMTQMARRVEACFKAVYRPQGINLGMNLGECAGAGIAGHLHLHMLPRWVGDANFMTTVGETRVMPEALADSLKKLREAWRVVGA